MKGELQKLRREVEDLRTFKAQYERLLETQQEKEEQFLKIFHASSNPMSILTAQDHRFIEVNDAYVRLSGFEREELIGRSGKEIALLTDSLQYDLVGQMLQNGEAAATFELNVLTKGGEPLTIMFSATPEAFGGTDNIPDARIPVFWENLKPGGKIPVIVSPENLNIFISGDVSGYDFGAIYLLGAHSVKPVR